jgi:hypothetical protein
MKSGAAWLEPPERGLLGHGPTQDSCMANPRATLLGFFGFCLGLCFPSPLRAAPAPPHSPPADCSLLLRVHPRRSAEAADLASKNILHRDAVARFHPRRPEALKQIVEIAANNTATHRLLIGLDGLGKEELLVAIADTLKTHVCVSLRRMNTIRLSGFPTDRFVCDQSWTGWRVKVVERRKLTRALLQEYHEEKPTMGIIASGRAPARHNRGGGETGSGPGGAASLHYVPFSLHSSVRPNPTCKQSRPRNQPTDPTKESNKQTSGKTNPSVLPCPFKAPPPHTFRSSISVDCHPPNHTPTQKFHQLPGYLPACLPLQTKSQLTFLPTYVPTYLPTWLPAWLAPSIDPPLLTAAHLPHPTFLPTYLPDPPLLIAASFQNLKTLCQHSNPGACGVWSRPTRRTCTSTLHTCYRRLSTSRRIKSIPNPPFPMRA